MGVSFGGLFMLLTMSLSGGDVLDMVGTDAYWQLKGGRPSVEALLTEAAPGQAATAPDASELIKQLGDDSFDVREKATRKLAEMGRAILPQLTKAAASSDAEVSARAKKLIEGMQGGGQAAAIRRLMTIRTLGEAKEAKAADQLKKLLQAKEPFVAEYARRAIAQIEGKPYQRPLPTADDMKKDLAALPASCAVVAQARMVFAAMTPKKMAEMMPAEMGDAAKASEKMAEGLIQALETCGNIRLDGLSAGVAGDIGDRKGFVVLVGRGEFDAAGVKIAVQAMTGGRGSSDVSSSQPTTQPLPAGVEIIRLDRQLCLVLLGNNRAALIVGPPQQALPVDEVVKGLVSGKGGVTGDADMAKLLAKVDMTSPIWAACRVTECYRQVPHLAGVDTIIATTQYKNDTLTANLTAVGASPEAVEKSRLAVEEVLKEVQVEASREAQRTEFLKPIAEALQSIQFKQEGSTVTGSGTIKQFERVLLLPMMILGYESRSHMEAVQMAAPVPAG
jgi:hypothetical protein